MRLAQCIARAVQVNGPGVATEFEGRRHTWSVFADRVARLASGMRESGVETGDRVACLALNSDRYLEWFFAVSWAGAVFVPVNTRLATPEVVEWLDDAGASMLFVDDAFAPSVAGLREALPALRTIVYMGDGDARPDNATAYEAMVAGAKPMAPVEGSGDDCAGIFYTGGTTGRSKGVMLSHDNLLSSAFHIMPLLQYTQETNYLHAAPMFHLANGAGMTALVVAGGANTIIDRFTPEGVLRAISEHRVSAVLLVPTMIGAVVEHPGIDQYDLSSLRTILYGGSPISEALIERTRKAFPGVDLWQAYGQTEAGPILTMLAPARHTLEGPLAGKTRSAGQAVPGVEVAILDEDGNEAPRGQVGEICGRGDNIMLGYWQRPDATARTLRGGWLHTEDAGYMDDEGYVFVVDRLKDMIVSGGENVYTAEVENALARHSDVVECTVFGIPSSEWGEQVHAVVHLRPGAATTEADLVEHCKNLIANYKCPRSIDLAPEPLPKSGAGKVLKAKLREPYWQGRARSVN